MIYSMEVLVRKIRNLPEVCFAFAKSKALYILWKFDDILLMTVFLPTGYKSMVNVKHIPYVIGELRLKQKKKTISIDYGKESYEIPMTNGDEVVNIIRTIAISEAQKLREMNN